MFEKNKILIGCPARSSRLPARSSRPCRYSSLLQKSRPTGFWKPCRSVTTLFFFLCSFLSFSQVTSSIDSTKIKIGEEILYTINVTADSTDVVVFSEEQTFAPLEMIESYKTDTTFEGAKYRLIKKYGLTQFDSGKYTIPPQRIFINNKPCFTDSIKVEVADVAVDTTRQRMFDIKPAGEVKNPPFDWLLLLYWLMPILLIAGIAIYLFRRKKRKDAAEK